jgi:hypothetical protein
MGSVEPRFIAPLLSKYEPAPAPSPSGT